MVFVFNTCFKVGSFMIPTKDLEFEWIGVLFFFAISEKNLGS